tara:strand:- start:1687 stop:3381 length:1695 start_codon:yes stop_codon:yes gene_type:complete
MKNIIFTISSLITVYCFSQDNLFNSIDRNEKEYMNLYFEAERNKVLEDYINALELYEKCIKINPNEPSAYNEIAKIHFFLNDWENSEDYIKMAISLDPTNKWYYFLLLDIYSINSNISNKLDVYESLLDLDPENLNYILAKIQILTDLKEYKKTLKYIKNTKKTFGDVKELLKREVDIYILQDNFKLSEQKALQLIEKFPNLEESYEVLTSVYLYFSQYDDAISIYQDLLNINPDNSQALVALYKIYSNKNDIREKQNYLLKIVENKLISLRLKKELFYEQLKSNKHLEMDSFKVIVEKCLSFSNDDPLLNLIMGDLYSKDKNYKMALNSYKKSTGSLYVKDEYVYNKMIEIHFNLESYNDVLSVTSSAIETYPFSARFYYLKALAHLNLEEYQTAIDVLNSGQDFIIDNNLFASEYYSIYGDIYHKIENYTKSDEYYDLSLSYNDENVYVLNNYSYYLSLRGEKLELALEMTSRCNELTTNSPNSSFLDTYAWVLYKLNLFDQAKVQIEKAIKLETNSSTIFDHYGDILYKLGDKTGALLEWQRALSIDPEKNEIRNKIIENE